MTRTPWCELLLRTFAVDALKCLVCGGRRVLRALVPEERVSAVLEAAAAQAEALRLPWPPREGPSDVRVRATSRRGKLCPTTVDGKRSTRKCGVSGDARSRGRRRLLHGRAVGGCVTRRQPHRYASLDSRDHSRHFTAMLGASAGCAKKHVLWEDTVLLVPWVSIEDFARYLGGVSVNHWADARQLPANHELVTTWRAMETLVNAVPETVAHLGPFGVS